MYNDEPFLIEGTLHQNTEVSNSHPYFRFSNYLTSINPDKKKLTVRSNYK